MSLFRTTFFCCLFLLPSFLHAATVTDFLPKNTEYIQAVPLPSTSLGFEIGQRHIRHDQLKGYFYQLEKHSERVKLTSIGKTAQLRDQFLVTISSPENLNNLEQLLTEKPDEQKPVDAPWLFG